MTTSHPLAKATFQALSEVWPDSLPFPELLARAGALAAFESDRGEDWRALSEILLRAYSAGLVELHVHPPKLATKAGERPAASPLARWQAQKGTLVTTLRHTSIQVEGELERSLLTLLDGSRDRQALIEDLLSMSEAGTDCEAMRESLAGSLEENLASIARLGLLLA